MGLMVLAGEDDIDFAGLERGQQLGEGHRHELELDLHAAVFAAPARREERGPRDDRSAWWVLFRYRCGQPRSRGRAGGGLVLHVDTAGDPRRTGAA